MPVEAAKLAVKYVKVKATEVTFSAKYLLWFANKICLS